MGSHASGRGETAGGMIMSDIKDDREFQNAKGLQIG